MIKISHQMSSHYHVIAGTLWSAIGLSSCTTFCEANGGINALCKEGKSATMHFGNLWYMSRFCICGFCIGYGTSRDYQNVFHNGCNAYCCLILYIFYIIPLLSNIYIYIKGLWSTSFLGPTWVITMGFQAA